MIARHWRPLLVLIVWLAFVVLAVVFRSAPQVPAWSAPEDSLQRVFGLPAEPTLLTFSRAGGLTPADRAYVEEIAAASPSSAAPQLYGANSGETLVLPVAADASDIPTLRAGLQSAPSGLETHVTGPTALAYDAVSAWEQGQPFVLLGVFVLAGLVALLGRLGPVRALVVALSAGVASTVTSMLAGHFAPPAAVALATVASAGLAGAWAVRLLMATPLDSRTPFLPRPPVETWPEPDREPSAVHRTTPLQRVLVVAGEMTLLQAFVVIVGLAGFLFDYRAGGAVLLALVVAVAVSLSATPALAALLAQPRPSQTLQAKVLRLWVRLPLLLLLIAGLYWLIPAARPTNAVLRRSDAATGYRLLAAAGAAGDSAVARLLPLHLLIEAPEPAFDGAGIAALQSLLADLGARPALAGVEGQPALQQLAGGGETSAALLSALAQVREKLGQVEAALAAQASALSQAITDVQGLHLPVDVEPLKATLGEASARLESVKGILTSTSADFSRIPTEFPEVASRIDHVPTLRTMPATLATAVTDLTSVSDSLREAITQTASLAGSLPGQGGQDPWAQAQERLIKAVTALETLTADLSTLGADVGSIEALLTTAPADDAPAPASAVYVAPRNVLRLALIPAADPYDRGTLNEVQSLQQTVPAWLKEGPLAGSLVTWAGAPVSAEAQRTRALQELLLGGLILATVAVALATLGTLARLGPTLLVVVGALLSVAAGVGLAAAVFHEVDAAAIALVAVALVALSGGRMVVGRAPAIEDLALALPPLTLAFSRVASLTAIGLALSAGLLANCFLIIPTLIRRPRYPAPENE